MDIWAQMSTMHLLWFIEHITFSITRFVEKVYIIYNTYYYVKSTCAVYFCNGAQRYEQFLQIGWLYRALILIGLALSSEHLCVFSLCGAIYIFF